MKKTLFLLSFIILNFSCVKDVDFNQIESSVFSTPMSIALLQTDLTQNDFLDSSNNEITFIYKSYLIDLSGLFYESSTDSLVNSTTFSSTFDRDINCQFVYFDATNTRLMSSEVFLIQSSNSPVTYSTTYEGANFDLFVQTRRIDVRITLRNGAPIQSNDPSTFSLQSVIHFIFDLQPNS